MRDGDSKQAAITPETSAERPLIDPSHWKR